MGQSLKMRISLSGLLRRCGEVITEAGDPAGYDFALWQLESHLRQLRDRHASGDADVTAEFFDLYTMSDDQRTAPGAT